jgi:hypothetical protein
VKLNRIVPTFWLAFFVGWWNRTISFCHKICCIKIDWVRIQSMWVQYVWKRRKILFIFYCFCKKIIIPSAVYVHTIINQSYLKSTWLSMDTVSLVLWYVCEQKLTPCSRVSIMQLTVAHMTRKGPALHENQRFIIVFSRARHWSLSWTVESISFRHPLLNTLVSVLRACYPLSTTRAGAPPICSCTQLRLCVWKHPESWSRAVLRLPDTPLSFLGIRL